MIRSKGMDGSKKQDWFRVAGVDSVDISESLSLRVNSLIASGVMPQDDPERVAALSMGIAKGAFRVSPERLEMLRGLCHLYSAGIRAEKITSHRRLLGPLIVSTKKAIFRILSSLLGPSFRYQRDFNAGVIRLLCTLCNEDSSTSFRK